MKVSSISGKQEQVLSISTINVPENNLQFNCGLEDGNYKFPINIITHGDTTTMCRKLGTTIPENEYFTFAVSNNIATITSTTITLNPENFVTNRADYSPTTIQFITDSIIKVS